MSESNEMKISMHCLLACLYFLLLPTTIAVNASGNSYLKLATIPIGLYFLITIIITKIRLQFNSVHFFLCLYTFSTLISLFIKSDTNTILEVLGYFLNAAIYLCLSVVKYNKRELKLMENVQVLLLAILIGITLFSKGSEDNRTTLEIFGQTSDPNYFVGFFIYPLSVTMKKFMESKFRIVYLILALLAMYCVFLSGSRGGLLAVFIMIAAFSLIYPANTKHKLLVLLAGVCFLLFAWLIIAPILPENIVSRMSVTNVIETGGTGRWDIWKSMLKEIVHSTDKLLFGRGVPSLHMLFLHGTFGGRVAHNHVIQTLYDQGLVGLIAFLMLSCACFLRCVNKRKTVAIAIIGMLALSVSLTFNPTTRTFWNLVAYAAFNFSSDEDTVSIENTNLTKEDNHDRNDRNTKSNGTNDGVQETDIFWENI